jgi:hypothetical protein
MRYNKLIEDLIRLHLINAYLIRDSYPRNSAAATTRLRR